MGLNVSIKLFLDIISLLEEVFEKPSSFFQNYSHHKNLFLKRVLFITKCFSEVKTFSSFWMFLVTVEKIGDVGGDGCSVSI
jgi:hypothetical protein